MEGGERENPRFGMPWDAATIITDRERAQYICVPPYKNGFCRGLIEKPADGFPG